MPGQPPTDPQPLGALLSPTKDDRHPPASTNADDQDARYDSDNEGYQPIVPHDSPSRGWGSLNHLIRSPQHRLRNGQAERLGGLEIHDELEGRGLLHR
jgi:hypothetical protein